MARIPETEIERLKNEVSVERLIESSGIELKKSGKDLTGKCPFHEDDTASLVVTPAKNLWHCFGCGAAGGPIDWVIKKNGVSFRHAVELLRDGIPSLAAGVEPVKRTTVRVLDAPIAMDADDQALLNQVVGYYHDTLKASADALAYLKSRGIDSMEAVDHFKLGYANRTLGLRLPDKRRSAGEAIRTRLEKIGIYRESGHEHFNGSLIVPVCDEGGFVTEIYGRKLLDNLRAGTPKHLYLPGAHAGVWNIKALQTHKEIILCEALIDALTFWCAGYHNVTSSYGIEGFTEDHLAAFKQYGTQRILIAYDRDEAGERGAGKVAEQLMQAGIECFRIQFPKGMDANEYALKVTPASHSLGLVIRKAVWLGNGKPPVRLDVKPVTASMPTAPEAAPVLASEPSSLVADSPTVVLPEPLPASPMPAMIPPITPCEIHPHEIIFNLAPVRYRVRGFDSKAGGNLRVNLLASWGEAFFVDTVDLYNARQRATFMAKAASELRLQEDALKADLGRILLQLELLQSASTTKAPGLEPMTVKAQREALALLKSPDLTNRILTDFAACGLVGEETNKLVAYLATVSRKLDKPLGIVIQSSSAAGKSSLMDAVLAFVPEEDKVKYSAMTGQSLFYMGETNLKHKALAIVEEEGASRASYALKLLQSEGELTIASTGKDPVSGNLITQQYRVEGPVALLVTTTARDIDEELMNRCLVLSVDEGREQTRAIHQLQRDKRTLQGLIARREKEALIALHQNAQRLLKPLAILNPFTQYLTFPDQTTRLRRDHEKYLTLIDTIAFLHQHQREIKTAQRGEQVIEYIEVTIADIELGNRIAHEVLGRSLDELPPQTRRLMKLVDGYVVAECERQNIKRSDFRFSRRALREAIHWGDTQLKIHLARLTELEYLVAHRTKTGGFDYELVYDVPENSHTLRFPGLADIEALKCAYDVARSGQNASRSGAGRPVVGGQSVSGRDEKLPAKPILASVAGENDNTEAETHLLRVNAKIASYPQPIPLAAAPRS
jgi:DNA primase catalytic core